MNPKSTDQLHPSDVSENGVRNLRRTVFLSPELASRGRFNTILYGGLVLVGLLADLATKTWIFSTIYDPSANYQTPRWWIDGVFGIQPSTNPGALFGMGAGWHQWFAGISIIFLVVVLGWLFIGKAICDRWLTTAMGMISAGILGNLYDRLGFGYSASFPVEIKNQVRDWILFRWEGMPFMDPWPNFNIADVCLVTGAIMLFIHGVWLQKPIANPESDRESGHE